MKNNELAYFRQTVLSVKDWDGFQQALRWLRQCRAVTDTSKR